MCRLVWAYEKIHQYPREEWNLHKWAISILKLTDWFSEYSLWNLFFAISLQFMRLFWKYILEFWIDEIKLNSVRTLFLWNLEWIWEIHLDEKLKISCVETFDCPVLQTDLAGIIHIKLI